MEDVSAHLLVGTETHMSAARWSTGESCAIGMGKTKFFSRRLISYAADRRLTCWVQRLEVDSWNVAKDDVRVSCPTTG